MHYLTLTNGYLSPASVYNHLNVSGILAEERFFCVVLTDKQYDFSMTVLFCSEFLSKEYIPFYGDISP